MLVPVKGFDAAKARLAPSLDAPARALLARTMATRVLGASAPLPAFVACDDEKVAAWAIAEGARVVWTSGRDLNGSVLAGVTALREHGFARAVVAHADLPFAQSLAEIAYFPGATIVPDRRDDGTNVLSVPLDLAFRPQYGHGSFARHLAQLRASGLPVRIARRRDLQWDVDLPEDLPIESIAPA